MKLHSKILLGLLIGLILGLGCNLFVTDKDLLKWIVENISCPDWANFYQDDFYDSHPFDIYCYCSWFGRFQRYT